MSGEYLVDELGNPITDKNPLSVRSNATSAMSVAPSDSTDLAVGATKGIYVGGSGNIAVTMADGNDVTFTGISAGVIHPISVKRVKATGTTATAIIAVY